MSQVRRGKEKNGWNVQTFVRVSTVRWIRRREKNWMFHYVTHFFFSLWKKCKCEFELHITSIGMKQKEKLCASPSKFCSVSRSFWHCINRKNRTRCMVVVMKVVCVQDKTRKKKKISCREVVSFITNTNHILTF